MGLDYHASSPCLVLAPTAPHNLMDLAPSRHLNKPSPGRKHPIPPSLNYLAKSSNSAAGRKRSIHDVDPEDYDVLDGSVAIKAPPKPKGEPIYGPGMTLIYPDDPGFSIAVGSQTGTWAEEQEEKREKAKRPIAFSRKSQRFGRSKSVQESLPLARANSPESIIDERGNTIETLITALGIGWKNIMTNDVLRDAAKAYARVIENHFALTEPTIMLEKESLSAYLVRAKSDGIFKFYLFHDTLSWCQLVGSTLDQTVRNLTSGPVPQVEGPQINSTPRSPTPPASVNEDIDMSKASAPLEVLPQAPEPTSFSAPVNDEVMQM